MPHYNPARRMHGLGRAVLVAAVLSISCIADAPAQSRWVVVNGQRLSDAQVADLARRNCSDIPNGGYWLNTHSGAWGYSGKSQVQGALGDSCNRGIGPNYPRNRDGTIGPFATRNRAQQVVNEYGRHGINAIWFHNGDGFYVRVSR